MSTDLPMDDICESGEDVSPSQDVQEEPRIISVESLVSFFDQEEIIENCTVQILTNSKTGEVSVGWWRNEPEE